MPHYMSAEQPSRTMKGLDLCWIYVYIHIGLIDSPEMVVDSVLSIPLLITNIVIILNPLRW